MKAEQCDLDKEAALLLSLSDSISGGQNASQEGSRRAHQLLNHMPVFPEGELCQKSTQAAVILAVILAVQAQ